MLLVGIGLFGLSFGIMGFVGNEILFIIGVTIFFVGFNIHEPIMQSLTSKFAKVGQKGSVLGVFNSFGYLGTFFGGLFGGFAVNFESLFSVGVFVILVSILWALLIAKMANPADFKNIYISTSELKDGFLDTLSQKVGIVQWYINNNDNTVVIKYDTKLISKEEICN